MGGYSRYQTDNGSIGLSFAFFDTLQAALHPRFREFSCIDQMRLDYCITRTMFDLAVWSVSVSWRSTPSSSDIISADGPGTDTCRGLPWANKLLEEVARGGVSAQHPLTIPAGL